MESLIIFLVAGTILMLVPILIVSKKYSIDMWKAATATVILAVVGTIGTVLMFYIENGSFAGISFFGAVFFVPIVFLLIANLLKISYGEIMDFCAVGECIMLSLMKVRCLMGSCCIGRTLYTTQNGSVRFPSREVEMVMALIIFAILMIWVKNGLHKGELYTWYLAMYGSSRFVLNFLREEWESCIETIPMGTIWSVCAVLISVAILFISNKKIKQ